MKNIPFTLFLFGLIFAPLAFGTTEQWSLAVLEMTTGAAFILFFVSSILMSFPMDLDYKMLVKAIMDIHSLATLKED